MRKDDLKLNLKLTQNELEYLHKIIKQIFKIKQRKYSKC